MSQTTVLAAAETAVATIAAVTVTRQDWPQALPWTGSLGVVIYLDPSPERRVRLTNGAGGIVEHRYRVALRAILGPVDATPGTARANLTALDDALRAVIYADQTLGGACLRADLDAGYHNLTTYTRDQVEPYVCWHLAVIEHRAANASAQP